jgi:hypothetical protein
MKPLETRVSWGAGRGDRNQNPGGICIVSIPRSALDEFMNESPLCEPDSFQKPSSDC